MPPRARSRKGTYKRASNRTRTKSKAINIKTLGFSLLQAEILAKNIFGTSLQNFLTNSGSGWQASGDPHNTMITLKEIFAGGQIGSGISIQAALERNFKANWFNMGTSMIGLIVAQKMLPKTGIPRQFNAISKMLGLQKLVRM
jgi:hypothetical protein